MSGFIIYSFWTLENDMQMGVDTISDLILMISGHIINKNT